MHKYNKIRGILRAKQGSQIPKFNTGGWLDWFLLQNLYNLGSTTPIPKTGPDGKIMSGSLDWLNATEEERLYATLTSGVKSIKDAKMKMTAEKIKKGLGNFANNSQLLILGGINMVSDKLFGGTENSSEFNTIDGALGTLQSVGGPVGWYATAAKVGLNTINKIGSREIEGHTMNTYLKSRAGNYGGLTALNNKVESDKTKEFGLFNNGGYKRALGRADKLFRQLGTFENIVNTADNQFAMAGNDLYLLGYEMQQNGGYPAQLLRVAKGGTLTQRIDLVKSRKFNQVINVDTKLVEEFKEGGKLEISEWEPVIELFEEWEPEIILEVEEFKDGGLLNMSKIKEYYKDYNLDNINFIYDESPRVEGNNLYVKTDEDAIHELWHFLSLNKPNEKYKEFYDNLDDNRISELGGNLEFIKRTGDPGDFYNPSEFEARLKAAMYMTQGEQYTKEFFKNLRSNENEYGYNMRDLLYMFNDENLEKIFNLKKGGTLGEELETPEIEETNQKNLIPEGALHKNKHHMEHTEGLTLKGIPVIDNDGEQLAEIELGEIIFTLEVTKKLEELYEDGSDEAAIEAGKLLVKEILFNTDDRTGLISKCEKGGKICQIEE